ncbi:MAG: hypothetical protein IKN30_07680 [Synergistaceae bacterium]|nr:hypothetical protein [Synergistaceae bacterium]
MKLSEIFDYLEGLRREAYVRAVMRNDVIGYIGSYVPVDELYEQNQSEFVIPVHGIDAGILEYSHEENLCPLIDATVTYAKTDKCPLIHSSKFIVVDDFCPVMTREILKLDKIIQVIHGEKIYEDKQINKLKYYSDLTGLQVYIAEYYTKFLTPVERSEILSEILKQVEIFEEPVKFIPVKVQSASGIYSQIDKFYAGKNYRIIEDFCNIKGSYDFVYENCPYCEGKKIKYEGD